jgi:hypothetical protein
LLRDLIVNYVLTNGLSIEGRRDVKRLLQIEVGARQSEGFRRLPLSESADSSK